MIRINRPVVAIVTLVLGFVAASAAFAAEKPAHRDLSNLEKSGTVTFEVKSVKLIAGASWGTGTLNYQGKSYPIKVKAASVGGIGYRSLKGVGDVYNLKRLEDFAGTYAGGGAGVTVADMGGGSSLLENGKEVLIEAKVTDSEGVQLALSAGGIQIKFAE